MKVKDITRVSLTTRRTAEKQRHLTIGNSLLGQVIIDDNCMLSIITEPFTHRASRERSNVLKGCGFGGSCGNDDRIFHGIILLECLDELGHSRAFLTNGNVDAVEFLGLVIAIIPSPLV